MVSAATVSPKLLLYYKTQGGNRPDYTSTGAYVVYLGRNAVSGSSKKQRTVAHSSTEAEYRSVADTVAKLKWLAFLLTDLGYPPCQVPTIYYDNLGATQLCLNPVFHSRMKHVAIDYHFIRDHVNQGVLRVSYVSADDQIADILTKYERITHALAGSKPDLPTRFRKESVSLFGRNSFAKAPALLQNPDMLKIPHNQVAGHRAGDGKLGPLVDDSGRFYKPLQGDERGSKEVSFYTSFSSNSSNIPDHIHKFFPTFYGTQLVNASDGSGLQPHLVLEDLTINRVNPSIIDIKIGSRTWPPHAPENYVSKCLKKDRQYSSLSVGFRLSGLQFHVNKEVGSWKPDRKYVMSLSAEKIKLVLRNFVSSNTFKELETNPDCVFVSSVFGGSNGILSQLMQLKAWFEDQTMYHFYSCSVLVSYEKELAIGGKDPKAEIKMIDFAHVVEGGGVIDHNFLGGLCSLIKFISEILASDRNTEPSSADVLKD